MNEDILTITTQDNAVELALTADSVRMRLSESVLQEYRREVDSDPDVRASGWAGRIARAITGAVGNLLTTHIEYPLYDLESLVDQNGTLVFTYLRRHRPSFEDITIDATGTRKPALAAFAPDDVARFVERFNALKAQTKP